ncbi:hypothetical protein [Rhizobium sp. HT1-10]|uniref:hypothetical protein n=1 Tax=Rhizobium sp. HT1-10 TaxID=3111638 RepID=UPI003C154E3E
MDEQTPKEITLDRVGYDPSSPTDCEHEASTRTEIAAALQEAVDHPDQRMSLDDVWKRFGLEH